jgi:hypothetical protein
MGGVRQMLQIMSLREGFHPTWQSPSRSGGLVATAAYLHSLALPPGQVCERYKCRTFAATVFGARFSTNFSCTRSAFQEKIRLE